MLEAFRPLIAYQAHRGAGHRAALYEQLLRAIAVHRVADRPDRFEPRMAKTQAQEVRPPDEAAERRSNSSMLKRVSKI